MATKNEQWVTLIEQPESFNEYLVEMKKHLKRLIYFFCGIVIFTGCNQKNSIPNKKAIIDKIRQAADLATVEYVVTKVIASKKGSTFIGMKVGSDATFMAKTKATIKAGIDLNAIKAEDVKISSGKSITINLPPVKMINFSYPAESFETVEEYTIKSFWNEITIAEKDELFRQGEVDIKNSIEKLGIQKTAEKNTRILLESILRAFGFQDITILFNN